MIYKIIVDKQPMTNPSEEKKEYEIDIAPLYFKRDVYDSLVITHDEDYVMRRLELQDYNVLVELDPPVKEPLTDINIELFEGENYIYLYDMAGNKIVAQYLVKNEFNELYVLESTMNSAITQSANAIELYVQQNYETLSHATSEYARIDLNAQGISTEVSKKVGNNEVISKINQSAEQVQINANKISLAGKTIEMTSDNVAINSTNFKVDKNGNLNCSNANVSGTITSSNATITGGKVLITGGTKDNPNLSVSSGNNSTLILPNDIFITSDDGSFAVNHTGNSTSHAYLYADAQGGGITLGGDASNDITLHAGSNTHITCYGYMEATSYQYLSDKKLKENIKKYDNNVIDIIKNSEIYEYTLKNNKEKQIGFVIGDEYKYPKEIAEKKGEYYSINSYKTTAILWKAIQEQQEQIEELKSRIEKLEKGDK